MVLSQRERYIAIALGGVLVLLVLWQVVYSPLDSWSKDIATSKEKENTQKLDDDRLFSNQARLQKVWDDMQKNGLKSDPAVAGNELRLAVTDWANQSGVAVTDNKSNNPIAVDAKAGFVSVGIDLTCIGTTSSIAKLIYQIEVAKIPARVHTIQISARKEGVDDLQAQLNLTTLCVVPVAAKPAPANQPTMSTEN